jgi:long-subunit acyl-CoA synthetase (AMP-forming)
VRERSLPSPPASDFTEADDELTPSLKKKRRVIGRHFEHVIDELYSAHNKAVKHD